MTKLLLFFETFNSPPFFFHQKIIILNMIAIAGIVNCKFSIIWIISPRTLIKECSAGIKIMSSNDMKAINVRKLHIYVFHIVCLLSGQSPTGVRIYRFKFTAHSKSTYSKKTPCTKLFLISKKEKNFNF